MIFRYLNNNHGVATLIALILVGMMTLIGIAVLSTSDDEVTIAGNEMKELKAFYAAESGLETAAAAVQNIYINTGLPPTAMPTGQEVMNQCDVAYTTTDDGPAKQRKLITGSLAGLNALVKTFTVSSVASNPVERASVEMDIVFEAALVPVFQFAVFYEDDLWTTPAYDMTIDGRVHVNGNMYLQASTQLKFAGKVSCAGDIYHGLRDGQNSGASGDVFFKHSTGLYQNMYDGSQWIDASDADWFNKASIRWGGNVSDHAFGVDELELPLTNASGNPHKMIERAGGNPDSYEFTSTFRIIDGTPLVKMGGVWQDASAMLPAGTITNTSFYDGHEGKTVNTTEIDMGLLKSSGYFPSNGVLYNSDQRFGFNGLRLVNGTSIGYPLSIYSENPVYVQGDYNTVNKQPAAVVADATTFLSNSWNDANSSLALSTRTPTPTTVNLSFITGDLTPNTTNYGGGLENLPRFLEDWLSTTFTIRGSMIALWKSHQATGTWSYANYYTAPTRDWGFDTDLNDPGKLPPETPSVRIFQRSGWRQKAVAFNPD